jgi:protein-S-isoprenylcysteine O-methyltransferase Ste14
MQDEQGSPDTLRYVDAGASEGAREESARAPEALCYVDVGKPDTRGCADPEPSAIGRKPDTTPASPIVRPQPEAAPRAGDAGHEPRTLDGSALTDMLSRAAVVALFTLLSVNLFADFMRNGHVTGLLLLAGESLVVVLTVVRRRARLVDRSVTAAVMTTLSLAGPPLLRASGTEPFAPDVVTAMISAIGLSLVVVGKMALGRSFGVVPANRGVVVRGPYMFVRHPIYTGYLITHVGFFMANPAPWNGAVILIADAALILRALMEERVLSADAEYQGYCQRVGWHLVPGVF